jgi:hypothetical protein
MIAFRTASGPRLRPIHLFLMLYRYLSGAYQLGDLSALNYVKGFLDGRRTDGSPRAILSISGHGIGEPEVWLSSRYPEAAIDVLSFRLVDTQLLQFLRIAGPQGVGDVFAQFREAVAPFPALAELVADAGLVPYWELQAEEWRAGLRSKVTVYSVSPEALPAEASYDIAYVSNSSPYVTMDVLQALQRHVTASSWIALLTPAGGSSVPLAFAASPYAREARERLSDFLRGRGLTPQRTPDPILECDVLADRIEVIPLSIPAPARSVLVGELLLCLMQEPVSDRLRIEALATVLGSVPETDTPVRDTLQLIMIQGIR